MSQSKKQRAFRVTTPMPPVPEHDTGEELNLFDPDNEDIGLFNLIDDEIVKLAGSKLLYFKRYASESDYDDVYLENRNKIITEQPIEVVAHYDPKVVEENLSEFGIEATNDQTFTFNRSYIERKLGRLPESGDQIQPRFQNIRYNVFEVQEDGFEIYGVYHIVLTAQILRTNEDEYVNWIKKEHSDLREYGK